MAELTPPLEEAPRPEPITTFPKKGRVLAAIRDRMIQRRQPRIHDLRDLISAELQDVQDHHDAATTTNPSLLAQITKLSTLKDAIENVITPPREKLSDEKQQTQKQALATYIEANKLMWEKQVDETPEWHEADTKQTVSNWDIFCKFEKILSTIDLHEFYEPIELPFELTEFPEEFWRKFYKYGSDDVFSMISDRHQDGSPITPADIKDLAFDQLNHFRETVEQELTPEQRSKRKMEQEMLETAETYFTKHPDEKYVQIATEKDDNGNYYIGKKEGIISYTFSKAELEDNLEDAFNIEDSMKDLEKVIDSLTILPQGNGIDSETADLLDPLFIRQHYYWLDNLRIPTQRNAALRNLTIIRAMQDIKLKALRSA